MLNWKFPTGLDVMVMTPVVLNVKQDMRWKCVMNDASKLVNRDAHVNVGLIATGFAPCDFFLLRLLLFRVTLCQLLPTAN